MSTLLEPALEIAMNEVRALPVEPIRNSLILIGLVLRTRSAIEYDWPAPHVAVPTRSPLKLAGPAVTVNVALALSPGAIGPAIVSVPCTAVVQPAAGGARLSL